MNSLPYFSFTRPESVAITSALLRMLVGFAVVRGIRLAVPVAKYLCLSFALFCFFMTCANFYFVRSLDDDFLKTGMLSLWTFAEFLGLSGLFVSADRKGTLIFTAIVIVSLIMEASLPQSTTGLP